MKQILCGFLFLVLCLAPCTSLADDTPMKDTPILDIQEIDLGSNVTAWLAEDHSVPVISVSLSFEGGSHLDPIGKEGCASLAAATLNEGAGDLDSKSFLAEMERHGIRLSFSDNLDHIRGNLKTTTAYKDKAFELLSLSLTSPRFDNEAVKRMRVEAIASLRYELMNPGRVASRFFFETLFADHPYGRVKNTSEASLTAVTKEDLHQLVTSQFVRDRMNITVSGAITADDLRTVLSPIVAALPETSSAPTHAPKAELKTLGEMSKRHHPGPQSVMTFVSPAFGNDDPDWYAAQVFKLHSWWRGILFTTDG